MTEYYKNASNPPLDALREIAGGPLKGRSDINPQWRYETMDNLFGLAGIGWTYTIDKLWTELHYADEVMAFAQVSVQVRVDGEWSKPVPGIGGNRVVITDKNGKKSNDDCYKMAVTDALSVALKMIGVGASVYRGTFDSKYSTESGSDGGREVRATLFEAYLNRVKTAPNLDQLKEIYTDLYKIYTTDKERAALNNAKDARKQELGGAK